MIATSEFNFYTPEQITSEETVSLKNDWQQYASQEKGFKGQKIGEGKGIVITAGGLKYFTSSWVLIATLRNLGCELPIEICFTGKS